MAIIDSVRQLRADDPQVSLSEMARDIGVSRQRIHQVCKRHGIETVTYPVKSHVTECRRESCDGRAHGYNNYCSVKCRDLDLRDYYICEWCEKKVYGLISYIRNRRFCSVSCSSHHHWHYKRVRG